MRRRALVWQLFPVYFLITLVSVLVVGFYALGALREFYYSQTAADLEATARMLRQQVTRENLAGVGLVKLQSSVKALSESGGVRITVISPSGTVLADSDSDPASMQNHSDRPEIIEALRGHTGSSRRRSPTLRKMMVYVALPVVEDGRTQAVLRVSRMAAAVDAAPALIYRHLAFASIVVAIVAGLVSLLTARRLSNPLKQLRSAAARFASGDFTIRAPVLDTEEFASLAETLNAMAARLDQQLGTISRQSRQQEAILASMREGVIAIGNDDKVLIVNSTAEEMLGIAPGSATGKTVQEAIRNPGLQRFLQRAAAGDARADARGKSVADSNHHPSPAPLIEEIAVHVPQERLLQLTGTALVDAEGNRIGALVVMNDITQTRRLENIRRDFVANVSHELKTPITSIKGFVETLLEGGALDDPAKAREFLRIVARQADRLEGIIEDLLALSSIEQRAEQAEITVEPVRLRGVIEAAAVSLKTKSEAANVTVTIDCPDDLIASVNAPLIEQAVTNLLDNAIKYSPAGSTVVVRAERAGEDVAIHVIDNGPGIEPEHLPRLFERFYRVDKARSRKLGGTGLGLAIVKHIAQAHEGRTAVSSTPGKGSTFSIYLPAGKTETSEE